MKTPKITAALLLALLATAGVAEARGCQGHGQGRDGVACQTSLADLPLENLNDFEQASLLQMREEEKLARDVYLALGEKFDLPVFRNIPRSEQRHMDQMGVLLERYGLEDPLLKGERGRFASPEMQKLHDELVTRGSASEIAALTVGATIEDLDICDLEQALNGGVDNQDIILVYRNLARGSRNHLRAFTRRLEALGATYQARYLTQAEVADILAAGHEGGPADAAPAARGGRGRGQGQRRGNGQGQGQGQGNCWN